jgi:cytochrome c biogenesis protein CcdA/glutaredoxin
MRTLIVTFFFIVFLSLPNHGNTQVHSPVEVYLFYTEECLSCEGILQGYLPALKSLYPSLEVKTFDIANPTHYEALIKLEKQFGRTGSELPVAFIGNQILAGEQEIMGKLDPLILEYQLKGGSPLPPIEISSSTKPSEKTFSVDLAYFYQKGCPKCDRANYLLKYFSRKYPRLNIKEVDINTPDGKRLNEALSNRLNLPAEKRLTAPSIFIGVDSLLPEEITELRLEALIQKYQQVKTPSTLKVESGEIKKADETIVSRFKSLGILTILSAGLIDGLNPCAFATLIFLISYLTMVGRKRKEILLVGVGFSGAVFLTYLLIGFGILSFVQHLSFLLMFSRIVYLITIAIAFMLGIYSLYDYVQLKRGRPSDMKLQLPDFLKKRIHRTIRTRSGDLITNKERGFTRYLLAAAVSGVVISILEFTCTGQVYLPTILFVKNIPSLRASAVSYLISYNAMFIVPLLTIFGVVYWGVTSEQLAFFLQKRASTIKLLTSLLFFTLAGILMMNLV